MTTQPMTPAVFRVLTPLAAGMDDATISLHLQVADLYLASYAIPAEFRPLAIAYRAAQDIADGRSGAMAMGAGAASTSGTTTGGGAIKRLKEGRVEIEYDTSASSSTSSSSGSATAASTLAAAYEAKWKELLSPPPLLGSQR